MFIIWVGLNIHLLGQIEVSFFFGRGPFNVILPEDRSGNRKGEQKGIKC